MVGDMFDIEDFQFDGVEENPTFPLVHLSERGDCLEFLFESDAYRRERIDDTITVFCSRDSDEIIGGVIKGIRALAKDNPPILFLFDNHGKVRVSRLLVLLAGNSKRLHSADLNDLSLKHYKRLIDRSEELNVEVELAQCDD